MTAATVTKASVATMLLAGGFMVGSRLNPPSANAKPSEPQEWPQSDPVVVRAKLETIGQALALYRIDFPAKPVTEWRTPADAGLPHVPMVLETPGFAWSIDEDDLHYPPGLLGTKDQVATDFSALYMNKSLNAGGRWGLRGHQQIVLFDPYYPRSEQDRIDGTRRTLVLRWNGSVELVTYRNVGRGGVEELIDK